MVMYLFSGVDSFKCYCRKDQECDKGGGEVKETHEQIIMDQ
jgi:hypothetical protein